MPKKAVLEDIVKNIKTNDMPYEMLRKFVISVKLKDNKGNIKILEKDQLENYIKNQEEYAAYNKCIMINLTAIYRTIVDDVTHAYDYAYKNIEKKKLL